MYDPHQEDPDGLIRKARIRAREMQMRVEGGSWDTIIADTYNVMYMAAKGALSKVGVLANTHQTVASQYRRMIIDSGLIDSKFAEHLSKIKNYWEGEQKGQMQIVDHERAKRIVQATVDLVDALAHLGSPKRNKVDPRLMHHTE